MITVSSLSSLLPYSRRVSFNNLRPNELEPGGSLESYRSTSVPMSAKSNLPPKALEPELAKVFLTHTLMQPAPCAPRKRLKLPEPPSKLILKNKLSKEQLRLNIAHAVDFGASLNQELNDLVDHPPNSVPRLELAHVLKGPDCDLETEDQGDDSEEDASPRAAAPTGRRKLFSGMTNEELMALDPQYSKPSLVNFDEFKFDPLGTSFSTQRRNSTPATTSVILFSSAVRGRQVLYPSLNENNYKCVTFTVQHRDYDHGDISPRTILTVISGRKHTWNSLDWLLVTDDQLKDLPGFLQNGDHLVVAALVPLKFLQLEGKSWARKKDSGELKVQQKCEDILGYILDNVLDPDILLKITVELVIDVPPPDPMVVSISAMKSCRTGTKFMMAHLFKQYQPTLVVIGNKSTSLNFKYPRRKTWSASLRSPFSANSTPVGKLADTDTDYLVKLSSYIVRYSTVPVVIVGNSTILHRRPASRPPPSVKFTDSSTRLKGILDTKPVAPRQNSYNSEGSIESFCGEHLNGDSSGSVTPANLFDEVLPLLQSSVSQFADLLLDVSFKSLVDLKSYLEQVKNDNVPAHFAGSKVHDAYVSTGPGCRSSFLTGLGSGSRAYKVKSMISYDEADEKKNEKLISDKKLKKSSSRSSAGSSLLGSLDEKAAKKQQKMKQKRKSFLQRIGLKKA